MKKAFLQLHIAVFLAGFTGPLGRQITFNEGMIVWYRLLFTAITMWVLYSIFKKIQRLPFADIMKLCGVGLIATLHWVTFYASIKYSNVSVCLVCFSSISFFTAIFEPLILRKRMNWMELLLGITTIAGIYVIFHFDTEYKTGIIIGIISAMLAALFPIYNRELLKRVNVETLLLWQQTGGLVFLSALLPAYLYWSPLETGFLPGAENLLWLLVLAWICSVWAFQLVNNALKRLTAFTVNLTYNLEPVYGIILAFIMFKENQSLSKWFYVGFGIIAVTIIVHILLLIRKERKLSLNAAS